MSGGMTGRKDGVDAGARTGREGLGMERGVEQQRQALRESMMALVPPTKEEIVRTIFIGGLTEGVGGDAGVERILRTCGNLRRWQRATDADGKQCRFGFAEFEDAETLGMAVEVLKDIEVPTYKQSHSSTNDGENKTDGIEKSKLLVRIHLFFFFLTSLCQLMHSRLLLMKSL
jgi:hypothetical protein